MLPAKFTGAPVSELLPKSCMSSVAIMVQSDVGVLHSQHAGPVIGLWRFDAAGRPAFD